MNLTEQTENLRTRKFALDDAIGTLVKAFEQETGLRVESISLRRDVLKDWNDDGVQLVEPRLFASVKVDL